MRLLIVILAAMLASTLAGSAQEPLGLPLAGSQGAAFPTLAPLVKKVTPSVVNIAVKGRMAQEQNPLLNDPFFQKFFNVPDTPAAREISAAGSGVVVDARQGLIVTNNHVVEHADEISVTLTDGRRFQAKRIGTDPDTDVAIIKVPAEDLVAIALGDSDKLEVGDYVVAIGNPFGIGQTVTQGIVSALRRTGLGIKGYEDFIQTDAPINPGNSGGALVSLRGELVGINTAIVGPAGGNVGIGFAIPANMVRDVMDQLVKYGSVRRGRLGVVVQDLTHDLAGAMGLATNQSGAVIANVEAGSAAERAGLKVGDVITAIDKAPVRSASDLRNKIGLLRIGDVADLVLLRGGKSMVVRASVAAPVQKLIEGGQINPLLEGASFGPVTADKSTNGVQVISVQTGSKAARAGLRKGDIITSVNQEEITGPDEFAASAKASAKRLLLTLLRDGHALFLVVQ
ncbi:Do family serine endopeptidase [Bosea psychrotolerans]|uniref:Serine protease Do/serine protease DegQ n=1 Tax=Bosea psychrotolerans TaxID=1871628 RepID=A0A2S4LXD2_9HYPH|nr:Do family serine endopeptidase [Bosea psychrotolerans]POR47114.1 serine protease Do/serine protease DegQ [Bosea psychrotolerans]